MKRRYAYRDPSKERKRPYERYASRVLDKRALRSMALQAIRRPAVAQGPLHDALLEIYGPEYEEKIAGAQRAAKYFNEAHAVLFDPGTDNPRSRFQIRLWHAALEMQMNAIARVMHSLSPAWAKYVPRRSGRTFVVTYIAQPPTSVPAKRTEERRDTRIRSRRDPPEKRKRPYERYAAKTMSKLALRRLGLQSIGRPGVAQGPLHDTLLEMYPDLYARAINLAHRNASSTSRSWAVLFLIGELKDTSDPLIFWVVPYSKYRNFESSEIWFSAGPQVVTYIARRKRDVKKSS